MPQSNLIPERQIDRPRVLCTGGDRGVDHRLIAVLADVDQDYETTIAREGDTHPDKLSARKHISGR